jgi:putative NADH-flavin reductase
MSAYAILGATGQVSGSILQLLGKSPNNKIIVLVRSRSKLEKNYPSLSSNKNIQVFQGSITDIPTLTKCITDTKAVFLTVAVNENTPGCNISLETTYAVVKALYTLRENQPAFKPPRLIILSSASLDKKFSDDALAIVQKFAHNLIYAANSYIYDDLAHAESYLRKHEDWLSMTFVMPGEWTHDVQQGHELNLEKAQTFISFLYLAGGMIEVADAESGRWERKNVSVVLKGGRKVRFEWWAPIILGRNLLYHFCPWFIRISALRITEFKGLIAEMLIGG